MIEMQYVIYVININLFIISDKGYINKRLKPELKVERDITLLFLKQ